MSLRLWSDDHPLADSLARSSWRPHHLHVKGMPIASEGALAGRIAKRHYASVANFEGDDADDVARWLIETAESVAADAALKELLRSREIEALFWIAVLGETSIAAPMIGADVVAIVGALDAKILIENYTERAPDIPTKTWFPPQR